MQVQVIVEPQEFERLHKLKEWDFVDTFTDSEVARWVLRCHASSHWSRGHPSEACCSRPCFLAVLLVPLRAAGAHMTSSRSGPLLKSRWCCCLQVAHVH